MNVQREVGGNLAEILDTISYTIRERVRIKGEIRVLTSQVMYSGRFLAMMPILIALALWLFNRPYMMQFFNPETRIVGIPHCASALYDHCWLFRDDQNRDHRCLGSWRVGDATGTDPDCSIHHRGRHYPGDDWFAR